jgi:hypothetical protein
VSELKWSGYVKLDGWSFATVDVSEVCPELAYFKRVKVTIEAMTEEEHIEAAKLEEKNYKPN